MTRAALTKLAVLVLLTFIICLPEFFTGFRGSKVQLVCLPYRPCEHHSAVRTARECDPPQTMKGDKWEKGCVNTDHQKNHPTDPGAEGGGEEAPGRRWFTCETTGNLSDLLSNISSAAVAVRLELSVQLQLRDAEFVNLTLYGHSNHSVLRLHPPEEDAGGQSEASYCCPPLQPPGDAASHTCLLRVSNQSLSAAAAMEKLPWKRTEKDEWRCTFRVLWLALLAVVLLTAAFERVNWRRCCKKPNVRYLGPTFTNQRQKDGQKYTGDVTPGGTTLHTHGPGQWTGLSPIPEDDVPADVQTLLEGSVDHCYTTANLHHRGPSPPSSATDEQTC